MSKITEIRFRKTRIYIWDWMRKTEWEKGCIQKKVAQTQTELEENRRKERERKQKYRKKQKQKSLLYMPEEVKVKLHKNNSWWHIVYEENN